MIFTNLPKHARITVIKASLRNVYLLLDAKSVALKAVAY